MENVHHYLWNLFAVSLYRDIDYINDVKAIFVIEENFHASSASENITKFFFFNHVRYFQI